MYHFTGGVSVLPVFGDHLLFFVLLDSARQPRNEDSQLALLKFLSGSEDIGEQQGQTCGSEDINYI